tara:strand:- start:195 stop:512 length:318 start_codon:yes stop_codon:yes gene_type:complete
LTKRGSGRCRQFLKPVSIKNVQSLVSALDDFCFQQLADCVRDRLGRLIVKQEICLQGFFSPFGQFGAKRTLSVHEIFSAPGGLMCCECKKSDKTYNAPQGKAYDQ